MNPQLKQVLARPVRPFLMRVDAVVARLESIDSRLALLEKRLDDIEEFVQATSARVSTVVEKSNVRNESAAQIARRIAEIESLLGARSQKR